MEIIWITLINYGYIEYTKNFLKSIEVNKVEDFRIVIYCINNKREIEEELKEYKNYECIDANIFLNTKEYTDKFTEFMTMEYKRIVFAKLDAIKYTLKNNREKMVGYIDMDIVLFRNPTEEIEKEMEKNPGNEIYAQCDEKKICRNKYECRKICSGLCVFRNREEIIGCLDYKEEDIRRYMSDQDLLLENIKRMGIKYITISKDIFINGGYKYIYRKDNAVEFPKEKCSIHYNFIVGDEKIKRMKVQKMWYI
jgi:hypothetical protein